MSKCRQKLNVSAPVSVFQADASFMLLKNFKNDAKPRKDSEAI